MSNAEASVRVSSILPLLKTENNEKMNFQNSKLQYCTTFRKLNQILYSKTDIIFIDNYIIITKATLINYLQNYSIFHEYTRRFSVLITSCAIKLIFFF